MNKSKKDTISGRRGEKDNLKPTPRPPVEQKKPTYEELLQQVVLMNEAIDNYERDIDESEATINRYIREVDEKNEIIEDLRTKLKFLRSVLSEF